MCLGREVFGQQGVTPAAGDPPRLTQRSCGGRRSSCLPGNLDQLLWDCGGGRLALAANWGYGVACVARAKDTVLRVQVEASPGPESEQMNPQ